MHRACLLFLFVLLPSLVACIAMPAPREAVHIEMAGSDSMYALVRPLADAYTRERPYVTINIQATNSEMGLRAAREYSGTIGLVARAIKSTELEQSRAIVVARDGIAIIVHKDNPINAITHVQLTQVFSGEIPVWPLGPSAGKNISVVSREDGSGTRDAFQAMVMKSTRVTPTAVVMPNESAVVDYVANHPDAIAYTSMGALTPQVHALSVDDIPLSIQTVENKQYPFIRSLAFVVPLAPNPAIQDFLNFVQGSEGQKILAQRYGRAP